MQQSLTLKTQQVLITSKFAKKADLVNLNVH